ncbi:hypothetical protein DW228_11550 [Bacteroides fragilis]|uniref:Uncharacterized protein n=1 Tax=Bacteroides fragilis TaxID=817 RepID=A0A396C0A4_BACFG|nr:hypothetical protein DW228_11550 [Bacteroides fragilis]RHH68266.1 hypothetical protein DW198_09575 [Bacteroides fragilis]
MSCRTDPPFHLIFNKGTKRDKSNYKTGSNSDKSAKPMYMHNAVSVQNLIFSHGIVYAICSKQSVHIIH